MKYARTVIKTPTGKWYIVGSAIPEYASGVFDTEHDAKLALLKVLFNENLEVLASAHKPV